MAKAKAKKPRKRPHWSVVLTQLEACGSGLAWARRQPSLRAAWESCEHGAWLTWLLEKVNTKVPCTCDEPLCMQFDAPRIRGQHKCPSLASLRVAARLVKA